MGASEGDSTPSRWPRRLLIVGIVSLIVGMVGLATTFPKIADELRPDRHPNTVIEPGESIEVNLTGLSVYLFFQNITNSDEIDGTITIISNGKEIELREGDKIEWRKNSMHMKNREIAFVDASGSYGSRKR